MKPNRKKILFHFLRSNFTTLIILLFFAIAYLILSINKHLSFSSGYDLSIINQAAWNYSQFNNPISTTHALFDMPIYQDHLEIILILISPLYWFASSPLTLIILQVASVIASGIAVYLISVHYKLNKFLSSVIIISYLTFFGIQFAIWSDVHSLVLSIGFLSWFLYFLLKQKHSFTALFFVLAIICKEDVALLTLLISPTHFIINRSKSALVFCILSIAYLAIVFFIYFPLFVPGGYHYSNPKGFFSDLSVTNLANTSDKQQSIFYSLSWYGFLPILSGIYLIPFFGDLGHYFVLGNNVVLSEGIFQHYRSTIALLLVWPTIIVVSKYKILNNWKTGIYLLACCCFFQYYLHLPLSYLSKSWFWNWQTQSKSINKVISSVPHNASLATQNNITPHVSLRANIYTLFPTTKEFNNNSPCNQKYCKWFSVGGNPEYLLVNTSASWNPLNLLTTIEEFSESLSNLEKNNNVKLIKQDGETKLYKIIKKI